MSLWERRDTETLREECHATTDWSDVSTSYRTPWPANHRSWKRQGRVLPYSLALLTPWFPDLGAPDKFKLPSWCFGMAATGKDPTPLNCKSSQPGTSSSRLPSSGPGTTLAFGREVTFPQEIDTLTPVNITVNFQAAEVGRQEQRMHILVDSLKPLSVTDCEEDTNKACPHPWQAGSSWPGRLIEENGWLHNYECNFCHGIVIFITI